MAIGNIVKAFYSRCVSNGVISATRWLVRTTEARVREKRLGIHTEDAIELSEYGIENPECKHYGPTEFADFRKLIRLANINPKDHVFVDFGAGMGRAMILAAEYPFKRVVGVEFIPELAEIAQRNIQACISTLQCRTLEVVVADATTFSIPIDSSVLYFNNPFNGSILNRVLENVRMYCRSVSHEITILCNVPLVSAFETDIRNHKWIDVVSDVPISEVRKCLVMIPNKEAIRSDSVAGD